MAQPRETDATPAEATVDAPADDAQPDAAPPVEDVQPAPQEPAVKPVPSARRRRPAKAKAAPEAPAPRSSDDPVATEAPAAEVAATSDAPGAPDVLGEAPSTGEAEPEVVAAAGTSDAEGTDPADGGADVPGEAPSTVEAEVLGTDADGAEHGDEQGDEQGDEGQPATRGPSRQRGLRAALASLPVPEPGPSFWADIDRAMAEQPPLQISARPAIRSINEPPPLSQPSLNDYYEPTGVLVTEGMAPISFDDIGTGGGEGDDNLGDGPNVKIHGDDDGPPLPLKPLVDTRANARKTVVIAAGVVAAVLIIGSALGRGGDDPSGADTTTTAAQGAKPTTKPTAATTAPAVPGLDAGAKLTGNGIGSLRVGSTLNQLGAAGVRAAVDMAMFTQNAGRCYVASLPASRDLRLGLRSPDPSTGITNEQEGVLASVTITQAPGSTRVTERGLGLGATEQQVIDAYPEGIEKSMNPLLPGGHLLLARQDNDRGVLYVTDGASVKEITVGEIDVIMQRQGCS